MLKKIAVTGLIFSLISTLVWAEQISKIAAVVNDEIITTRQLEQRLDSKGLPHSSTAERQELDTMIADLLMEQRGREIGLEVTEDDIEKAITDVEQQNNIGRDQLEQALIAQGMTLEGYRDQLRQQILRYKLMGHEVQSKVDITRQEVRNYYQQHLDQYQQESLIRLSRLSFPVGDDPAAAEANAQIALRKLDEGKSVDEILLSMSPTTSIEGGEMGSFAPGELSTTFEAALQRVETGQHTGMIALGGSLHILKVEERTAAGVADLGTVEDQIRAELRQEKMAKKLEEWRGELRSQAYVDVRL